MSSSDSQLPRLFVNYRHRDTGPAVARLVSDLESSLAAGQVFDARYGIVPGANWRQVLRSELERCSVVFCMIGSTWLDDRLTNPEDPVRMELERAIELSKTIVPVLVGDAPCPRSDQLPTSIAGLADLHAARLRDVDNRDWVADIDGLRSTLRGYGFKFVPLAADRHARPAPPEPSELMQLVERREELVDVGAATSDVDEQIRRIKARLRSGPSLKTGDVFADRFQLQDNIGHGGFGVVWRAWDRLTDKLAAVKVLHTHFSESRERRDRFVRGALRMHALRHPNIVEVLHTGGTEDGYHWFAMEFLPGGHLGDAVLEDRLTKPRILRAIHQVADALEFAASLGVVHRDVKPSNILLGDDGAAKLTDFDLVKVPHSTQLTIAIGDYDFGAPEILRGTAEATRASDVFSLATTALFCLSGGFLPTDRDRTLDAVLRQAALYGDKADTMRSALEPDPARRLSSAKALADALLAEDPLPDAPDGPTPSPLYPRSKADLVYTIGSPIDGTFSPASGVGDSIKRHARIGEISSPDGGPRSVFTPVSGRVTVLHSRGPVQRGQALMSLNDLAIRCPVDGVIRFDNGDHRIEPDYDVSGDTPLCFVQLGDYFIEIRSPVGGQIVSRYPEDGAVVRRNDKLFSVVPPGHPVHGQLDRRIETMLSPMVGTYYRSPSPDASPFIAIGDTVEADETVICIIEAMKVMNEIKSEVSGRIVEIHPQDGEPLDYGQPLVDVLIT